MKFEELKSHDQWVCWDTINGRKVPVSVNGKLASSTDPDTWSSYTSAVQCAEINGYSGVGFVFTRDDEFCGVDLDDCIDSDGKLSEKAKEIVKSLGSYTEISPSGKGLKIFGRCKEILKGRNRDSLEAYTYGRFFTVTGDAVGDIDDLNDITGFMAAVCGRPKSKADLPDVNQEDVTEGLIDRARAYLSKVAPSVQGCEGDKQLFSAISFMAVGFGLSRADTLTLIAEYNDRCDPPWEMYDIERKLDMIIQDRELDPSYLTLRGNDAIVDVDGECEALAGVMANRKADPLPERFIDDLPRGPIRRMYDHILETSSREAKGIAFSGALSWYCGLLAGKVMDESGIKTNLYTITLAPSSAGKQAPQDAIRSCADDSEGTWVSGKVTSDSAIGSVLKANPSSLCLWDEVGLFFQKASGGVAGSITDLLLDLWGAVNVKFKLKQYADSEKDIVIDKPCFGFHGWSTADHFWAGLTRMHLRDGFAGRLLVFETGPRATRKRRRFKTTPQELVDIAKAWRGDEGGLLSDLGVQEIDPPIVIPVSDDAEAVFDAMWDKVEAFESDDDQAIWGRAPEKARKIALALACQRGKNVTVEKEDAQYACDLVDFLTTQFVSEARRRLTVGDNFKEARVEVINELKRSDGISYWGPLMKAVGCSERVFKSVIDTLVSTGVVLVKNESGGKRKVVYCG
jgi:hypothetical protein